MSKSFPQSRLGADDWENWAFQATPLFKWAGGKRRFIIGNSDRFPSFSGTYHEPFAGSLAVYFWMAAKSEIPLKARLSDANLRLIRTYQAVKSDPKGVWESLSELIEAFKKSSDAASFYYKVREEFNLSNPKGDAPRFMFLMATGWNGVYRTNLSGKFNVPFGNNEKLPKFPTELDVFVASTVLQHADLRACSWETSLNAASAGDFVFLDPPYLVANDRESTIYEKIKSFSFSDHQRLANELVALKNRGVDFMLTNSFSTALVSMYRDLGLSVDVVSARRSISAKIEARGEEGELIVTAGKSNFEKTESERNFNLAMRLMKARKEKDDE
jgi:DNA adenine methylase